MRNDGDHDRTLVRLRLLQRPELAVEELRRHKVPLARGQPPQDQIAVAFEIDEGDIGALPDENIAVRTFERRAGNHAMIASLSRRIDPGRDGIEPGPAVLVGERLAPMHLVDVRLGMKPIGVLVDPMQLVREHGSDGGLAAARYAHDNDYGCVAGCRLSWHGAPPTLRR